jgi:hypothetical protein
MAGVKPREAFDGAVGNIARWGDTDVFPFPTENHILHDKQVEVVDLLVDIHGDLPRALAAYPPAVEGSLSLVSYEGLRWVTQLDPVWNAYFLGLVLCIGSEIEQARLARSKQVVFSYRFAPDQTRSSLFADDAWGAFARRSAELAESHTHVVVCDIADFYSRIYHHRIKNALQLAAPGSGIPGQIDELLSQFSGGTSYGLPVGGPAARLLAELALARVDALLEARGIRFTRYADDYRLFATSQNAAYRSLLFLAESLLRHDGLTLVKQKTRVLHARDFARLPLFDATVDDELDPAEKAERRLLRLSLRYDPYAPHAAEDYERLKESLSQFDILGMLTREVSKSRVNPTVVKRLVSAIRFLPDDVRGQAVQTLVHNLEALAPALPVTLRVLEDVLPSIDEAQQRSAAEAIRASIASADYYLQVPVNLAYALRALRHDRGEENIAICMAAFDDAPPFIKRDIVYLMHNWGADFFLSDKRRQWTAQHPWVQRALLVTSYALGDEGSHWRTKVKQQLGHFDVIARDWMAARVESGQREVPI